MATSDLREESGVLNARVEDLLQRAEQRSAQIRDAEGRIDALRRSASEAGESLLRLHGEQKQAEEALSHQSEALRKLETRRGTLVKRALAAVSEGIECDPRYLPRSMKNTAEAHSTQPQESQC